LNIFIVDGKEVTFFLDPIADDPESAGHTFRMEINGPLEVHMILSKTTTLIAERLFLLIAQPDVKNNYEAKHVTEMILFFLCSRITFIYSGFKGIRSNTSS
jgi:hypothetical protein